MDLGICFATLLSDPFRAPPEEVAAAAVAAVDAGFTEASVWTFHLDTVASAGLRPRVVEAAAAWAGSDPSAVEKETERLARDVERHGASVVLAVCLEPSRPDVDRARVALAALAERVGPMGAQVCLEFFPPSGVPDLASAWSLVEPLGEGVGLVIDTFHWHRQRGGPDLETLATIPAGRVGFVQVSDVPASPGSSYEVGALTARELPGRGVVDFTSLIDALRAVGADPFVATAIYATELVSELGPQQSAVAMRDATRTVLTEGR